MLVSKPIRYIKICPKKFQFILACGYGLLNIAKTLYNTNVIDIHFDNDKAFKDACARNHLDVVKYLCDLKCRKCMNRNKIICVDIHNMFNDAFKTSCENKFYNIADYLIERCISINSLIEQKH
jgi:hypothetical protein